MNCSNSFINSPFAMSNIFCNSFNVDSNKTFNDYIQKSINYELKVNELYNLIMSEFTILNVPISLPGGEYWILKNLILNGYIAFTDKTSQGLIASPLNNIECNQFNEIIKGRPTVCDVNSMELIKLKDDKTVLDKDDFTIVYFNRSRSNYNQDILERAYTYALSRQLINNNIFIKSLSVILQGKDNMSLAFDDIIDAIFNQDGIVKVDLEKGARVEDFLKTDFNNAEWIADKVIELNKHLDNELLLKFGVNHIPYEKKERLTNDEIATNNQALDIVRNGILTTVNDGLKKVNEMYNTKMKLVYTSDNYTKNNGRGENDVVEE